MWWRQLPGSSVLRRDAAFPDSWGGKMGVWHHDGNTGVPWGVHSLNSLLSTTQKCDCCRAWGRLGWYVAVSWSLAVMLVPGCVVRLVENPPLLAVGTEQMPWSVLYFSLYPLAFVLPILLPGPVPLPSLSVCLSLSLSLSSFCLSLFVLASSSIL